MTKAHSFETLCAVQQLAKVLATSASKDKPIKAWDTDGFGYDWHKVSQDVITERIAEALRNNLDLIRDLANLNQ